MKLIVHGGEIKFKAKHLILFGLYITTVKQLSNSDIEVTPSGKIEVEKDD